MEVVKDGSLRQLESLKANIADVPTLKAVRQREGRIREVDSVLAGLNSKDASQAQKAMTFLAEGLNEDAGIEPGNRGLFHPSDFEHARFSEEYGAVYFRESRIIGDFEPLDESDRMRIGTRTRAYKSPDFTYVAGKLNGLEGAGLVIAPNQGRLAYAGVIIVNDLLDYEAIRHERKHRRDLFINARLGSDRALGEVLAHLCCFEPEGAKRGDWQRLAERIAKNSFVVNCFRDIRGQERERCNDRFSEVLTNCYRVYDHMRKNEDYLLCEPMTGS
ncbi:MAG: hypothetical protein V1875_00900 [Candidatus Altiarchaeota archaeon]